MHMGEKVYKRRQELEFTQVDLEERSRVPQSVISRIERGILTSPRADIVRRLAKALGVTADYLIGMYDEDEEGLKPADEALVGAEDLAGDTVLL